MRDHAEGVRLHRRYQVLWNSCKITARTESLMQHQHGVSAIRRSRSSAPKCIDDRGHCDFRAIPKLLGHQSNYISGILGSTNSFGAGNPQYEQGPRPYTKSNQHVLLYKRLRSSKTYKGNDQRVRYGEIIGTSRLSKRSRKTHSQNAQTCSSLGYRPQDRDLPTPGSRTPSHLTSQRHEAPKNLSPCRVASARKPLKPLTITESRTKLSLKRSR